MAASRCVVFIHPDLGIGGAERLIVDAALAIQQNGYDVFIFTSHHDENHCFTETKDGTLRIKCVGDWLPRSIFGRCFAACAYLRMIYVALYLLLFTDLHCDIVFCDLVSVAIPVVKCFSKAKIIFYCHFPDQLLTDRKSLLKRLYRWPIDWLEERTTGMADCVLVNSKFTASVFRDTFRSLDMSPEVLYPVQSLPKEDPGLDVKVRGLDVDLKNVDNLFLSINRYERKKKIELAIESLDLLKDRLDVEAWRSSVHLVIAGGYDDRVTENVEYQRELSELVAHKKLGDKVTFLRSFSDIEKRYLLHRCTCLIYTPDKEHFGIVPIEAMFAATPVIAVNSGGPLETVIDGKTGFLCSPTREDFAEAMQRFVCDHHLSERMGKSGKKHVRDKFSFEAFRSSLNDIIVRLLRQ